MPIRPSRVVTSTHNVLLVLGVSALCGVLFAGLALPVVAGVGLTAREGADAFADMPAELDRQPLAQNSVLTDAEGSTLSTLYEENRVYVGLDNISQVMKDAILAIEDNRFYERGPIDFQGTLRAFFQNLEAGSTQGGGSTLTQQYVKLVRIAQAQTPEEVQEVQVSSGIAGYRRKLEELRMAVGVEKELSKDEIFEKYLNAAYFGSGAHGVETAAKTYFSKKASELNLQEAAMLAGLVQQPASYDPTKRPEAALARRNTVLDRMAKTGRITEEQATQTRKAGLGLKVSKTPNGCLNNEWVGYFCDYVVHEIRTLPELGETPKEREQLLLRGGLKVTTTLDLKTQRASHTAVRERVAAGDGPIASAVSLEPQTGHIKAMSNSRTYGLKGKGASQINYAVDEIMGGGNGIQPGSSFKPFVLAAAINQGIGLDTKINAPQNITLAEGKFRTCDGTYRSNGSWSVKNSTGSGTFNLKTATERSVNTFYAQLTRRTGLCAPLRIAQKSGVLRAELGEDGKQKPLRAVPSFALGSNEVSPLSMAQAYGTFANRGKHCQPTAILKITDSNGKVLVDHSKPECETVLKPEVADAVNNVLQGVIHNSGATGGKMKLKGGRLAAGKTGTTNNAIAVWFVGYVPQLATAVAVADVDGTQESLDGRTFNGERIPSACGGCIPGPIWKKLMDTALAGEPKQEFVVPDSKVVKGVTVKVPDVRGKKVADATKELTKQGFQVKTEEINSDLAKDIVVRTGPGPGSTIGSGAEITLYVSNGKPPARPKPEDDDKKEDDKDDNKDEDKENDNERESSDNDDEDNNDDGDDTSSRPRPTPQRPTDDWD